MTRLGILVGAKGRGSNMASIVEATRSGRVPAEVVRVLAPRADSPALGRASELGVPVAAFNNEEALLHALADVDWLCLAGYMRLLPASVVAALDGRVLNVHPALLPRHGGKGMYGIHVHEAVLAAGDTESGATVHLVNERYDEGAAIVQLRCPVLPTDTAETLAARVLELEHEAYVLALRKVLGADA